MNSLIILIFMIFMHIVDDYYLQGVLAKMKQKSWWQQNYSDEKNNKDYIVALICHSFSWSIMIILPILFALSFTFCWKILIVILINVIVHSFIDDLKANKKKINLIYDQIFHLIQIIITWLLCLFVF